MFAALIVSSFLLPWFFVQVLDFAIMDLIACHKRSAYHFLKIILLY